MNQKYDKHDGQAVYMVYIHKKCLFQNVSLQSQGIIKFLHIVIINLSNVKQWPVSSKLQSRKEV